MMDAQSCRFVIHDRDRIYSSGLDSALKAMEQQAKEPKHADAQQRQAGRFRSLTGTAPSTIVIDVSSCAGQVVEIVVNSKFVGVTRICEETADLKQAAVRRENNHPPIDCSRCIRVYAD